MISPRTLELQEILRSFYSDEGMERLGFVMKDGSVVEVANNHTDPANGGEVDPLFLIKNEDIIEASFHTHPGASGNLSTDDHQAFYNWPNLKHYVVGNDGVFCYVVKRGAVVNEIQGDPSRSS